MAKKQKCVYIYIYTYETQHVGLYIKSLPAVFCETQFNFYDIN